ncbi:MAG: FHA domain-containing protein [Planctomycetes bacterium]|nr:FHA domain-containing protein [Planctomycetota bacterium]
MPMLPSARGTPDPATVMPKLIIQFQGREWSVELREGSNTVGRSSKCGVPIRDVNMSREHCDIRVVGGVATLFDKGSMNGTVVNGVKVLERPLSPGDKIEMGAVALYFEQKGPGEATAPATSKAKGQTQRQGNGKRAADALIKDYAAWPARHRLPARAIASAVGIVLLLGLAVWGARSLGRGPHDPEGTQDLLGSNGTFEVRDGEGPRGWQLRSRGGSRISLDETMPHGGGSALVIEKSSEADDLAVECRSADDFSLGEARRVKFSAWTKCDGFGGLVMLKVVWIRNARGPVLLEEVSPPVEKPTEWTRIDKTFEAPAGAEAFYVAVCAIGRAGRILVDDARVVPQPGRPATREKIFGAFAVDVAPSGVFQVVTQGRRILANVHVALASEKEGVSAQTMVPEAGVACEEGRIVVNGRLPSPVDLRPVEFEQQIVSDGDGIVVAYTFPEEALKAIEGIQVVATIPKPERVTGLPASGESATPRVTVRAEGVDVVIEYADPTAVLGSREQGAQKLVQIFPIRRATGRATVGFKLRGAGAAGVDATDPLKAAQDLISRRQDFAAALGILREHGRALRDPETRRRALEELERLEERERRDWEEVEAACFRARIGGRPDVIEAARGRVGVYERHWNAGDMAAKAQAAREELDRLAAESATRNGEKRSRELLERAKAYAQAGERTLAAAVCETLLERYGQTEAAREAAEILKAHSR